MPNNLSLALLTTLSAHTRARAGNMCLCACACAFLCYTKAHKAKMDLLFEQQQQKALAKGYVHDVQVDFGDGDEDAGWDSD